MLPALVLYAGFILGLWFPASGPCSCLPKGMKCTDIVSAQLQRPGRGDEAKDGLKVTVEQKLKEIKARCRKGKLVDPSGKQVYFYRLKGCWGNPPEDYQQILIQQSAELEKLRRRYRVIEMTCNPSGSYIS